MGFLDSLPGIGDIFGGLTGSKNADAAKYAADRQWEIANKIQTREEFRHQIWRDHYKQAELRLKNEVCQRPIAIADYGLAEMQLSRAVTSAYQRVSSKIERGIDLQCTRFSCGNDTMVELSRAGVAVWAASMTFRADEDRAWARNQQRYEDKARVAAFGSRAYFATRGAQLAMGVYAQSAEMALRQQSNMSSALGYFLQRGLSYAASEGWFGSNSSNQSTITASTLSGNGGADTARDGTYVSLPQSDYSTTTTETATEPMPASEMGQTGMGSNYPS